MKLKKTKEEFVHMALKDTIKHLRDLLQDITHDLQKAEGGNKAASQRVRTGTVKLEKIAKLYRKESIRSEKSSTSTKKPAKKAAVAKAKPKVKAKPGKTKALASRPRAFALRRPTARIPLKAGV
jgi:DNA-binding protein H-NS